MASTAKHVPEEHQPLCEGCGYILEGLPADTRCPECGKPVLESVDPDARWVPIWEQHPGPISFVLTSVQVLFRPSHFYRHFATRHRTVWSKVFAWLWLACCSLLFSLAGAGHMIWLEARPASSLAPVPRWLVVAYVLLKVFALPAVFFGLLAITRIAARLTAWEAAYRGLRLPLYVVQRGLDYHAAHLLPVALVAALTVNGARLGLWPRIPDLAYLWTLSGEVIVCAAYLFFTYWACMRNMLFANK